MKTAIMILLMLPLYLFAAVEVVTDKAYVEEWTKALKDSEIEIKDPWGGANAVRKAKFTGGFFEHDGGNGETISAKFEEPLLFLRSGETVSAIAVIGVRAGGTGYWQTLMRFRVKPRPLRQVQTWPALPDREPVQTLGFKNGHLMVNKLKHLKGDADCCASGSETLKFKLKD